MTQADVPFPEHPTVSSVRDAAWRFAGSSLPIYVTGEVGTGRQVLATALARNRAGGGIPVEVDAGRALPAARPGVALLHHPELLGATDQVKLATWIGTGTRVVAWGRPEFLTAAHPELRPHIGSALVVLPPLRERGGDAIAWAHHLAEQRAGSAVPFARDADDAIGAHRWPGNIVQLDATVARALALREGSRALRAHDFDLDAAEVDIEPLAEAVDRFRRGYILRTLERLGGNRTRTAKALGVDARTVFRYLERKGDE